MSKLESNPGIIFEVGPSEASPVKDNQQAKGLMMNNPKDDIYTALRLLELALSTQDGLNYVRDTCGDALEFTIRVSKMIDAIEKKEARK